MGATPKRRGPQPGPQTAFLASSADIAIYGGAAGGGKSYGLLLEALRHKDVKGFGGVIFRRTSPQLIGAGSLWEEANLLFRPQGAKMREMPNLSATFPSGALIQFQHLQHAKDVHDHQGKQYAFIGFDELTHFEKSQFWYLVSRMRSTCGVRPYMRCTTNPDPDSFVRELIDWWIGEDGYAIPERSGVVRWFVRDGDTLIWSDDPEDFDPDARLSLTFISASLADNPALTDKDPSYRAKLMTLPEVERERLLRANWDIRPEAGKYIKRPFFDKRWQGGLPQLNIYIASDYAVTELQEGNDPDHTEHGVFGLSPTDDLYVLDWWHGQTLSDIWIERLIDLIKRHKPSCVFGEQGVIQKAIEPVLIKRMRERRVYARLEWLTTATGRTAGAASKQGYADASKRAKSIRGRAFQARAAMGKVLFPADDAYPWVRRVIDQCVGFPNGKDDAFDVMSHICLAIDQAHPAIHRAPPKPPKRHDYDRDDRPRASWKVV